MRDVKMKLRSERARVLRGPTFRKPVWSLIGAAVVPLMFGALTTHAQSAPDSDADLKEIVVTGDRLDVMQTKPVDAVFGFGKTVLETPRSLTTISSELLEKTIITDINDLVAMTPGSFTQSF